MDTVTRKDIENLEKLVEVHVAYMDKEVRTAAGLMKDRMDGFPDQFVKKGDCGSNHAKIVVSIDALTNFMYESKGFATARELNFVRRLAIGAIIISVIDILLRYVKP